MANISASSLFKTTKSILLYVPNAEYSRSFMNTESKASSDYPVVVVLACSKALLFEVSLNSATSLRCSDSRRLTHLFTSSIPWLCWK